MAHNSGELLTSLSTTSSSLSYTLAGRSSNDGKGKDWLGLDATATDSAAADDDNADNEKGKTSTAALLKNRHILRSIILPEKVYVSRYHFSISILISI